ncbi:MAG: prolipoprotein diacylglyceryl transferase, partial [Novosphingobium sp.]
AWRGGLSFLRVIDYVAVVTPFGMLFGRLANFINGELWGRVAESPIAWAMVFPGADAGPYARHPSQLYQAGLEGLLLLIVMLYLFWRTNARFRPGLLAGVFATGMGLARFVAEFFREPDAQLSEFAVRTGLSMGQWLTIPLFLVGVIFMARALIRPPLGGAKA